MLQDYPQAGYGNWRAFDRSLEETFANVTEWKSIISTIDKPWLVWHVSARWTLLQQRLVRHIGWTPVVGGDPRAGAPPLEPGSVYVDFNRGFNYPLLLQEFPLEFIFLFAKEKCAYWHSDLLCGLKVMDELGTLFERLAPGEMAAVHSTGGRRNLLFPSKHRYWELVGCSTIEASRSQFDFGAGWWMHFSDHPRCPDESEKQRRQEMYWDHGAGIMYWKRKAGGLVHSIKESLVAEGHCTSINKSNYNWTGGGTKKNKTLHKSLDDNYDIAEVARRFEISHLLD